MKYKIIKTWPDGPQVGTIFQKQYGQGYFEAKNYSWIFHKEKVESSPEFFAPLKCITEEGEEIYRGDDLWYIYTQLGGSKIVKHEWILIFPSGPHYKFFSSPKAAQSWIDEQNKPKFVENDWIYVSGSAGWESLIRFHSYNIPNDDFFSVTEDYTIYTMNGKVEIGGYSNKWPMKEHGSVKYTKAPSEDIQRILSKVALHKGFKDGVIVNQKVAYNGNGLSKVTIHGSYCKYYECGSFSFGNTGIYSDGKWAEILPQEVVPEIKAQYVTYHEPNSGLLEIEFAGRVTNVSVSENEVKINYSVK